MKKLIVLALICLNGLCFAGPLDFTLTDKRVIAEKIDNIIKKTNPNVNIGIDVRETTTGSSVYQRNNKHIYSPASIMKLLTAIVGLDFLGPQYQFKTTLSTNGLIKGNVLEGNLAMTFSGDPTLTTKDISELLQVVKQKGVRTISGNFYVDNSAFGKDNLGPGWMWDELRFCYAAPINAIIVNHNCLPFNITPNEHIGKPANISLPSDYEYITVINTVSTVARSKQTACPLEMSIDDENRILLSGCLAPGTYQTSLKAAATNIDQYINALIKKELKKNQLTLQGNIINHITPADTTLLATHLSSTLSELVKIMLKESDNVIASALFKAIGANYYHSSASFGDSQKALITLLNKYTHMPTQHVRNVDGSGLSRYNLITPNALVTALVSAANETNFNYLYNALPISGIDGTLRHRMGQKDILKKVHAKTGTMSSVSALSGYVDTKTHGKLAFVIIINGFQGSSHPYRIVEDNIISYLASL